MGNTKNLKHAEHNEKVCKHLNKNPDFTDWTITTAFYSALHYAKNKLLPVKVKIANGEIEYTDFESFYNACKRPNQNKHRFMAEKLEEHHEEIADEYLQMLDASMNARYHNYKFDRINSNRAIKRLKTIKNYCVK